MIIPPSGLFLSWLPIRYLSITKYMYTRQKPKSYSSYARSTIRRVAIRIWIWWRKCLFQFLRDFFFWLFGVGESGKFNSDHRKILEDIGHPQLISSIIIYHPIWWISIWISNHISTLNHPLAVFFWANHQWSCHGGPEERQILRFFFATP